MKRLSKAAVDHLQEVRGKQTNKIKYQKRLQEEKEFDEYLKEILKRIDDEDESFSTFP